MPRGKTTQPLRIKVSDQWVRHPAILALQAAGHQIIPIAADDVDWVCHKAAGWHDEYFAQNEKSEFPFVEARLKAERARKRAGK